MKNLLCGRYLSVALLLATALFVIASFNAGPAHAQNSVVVARGVQTGTMVFGNGGGTQVSTTTGTVTLGTPVDSTKAFVHCSFSTSQGGANTHPTCELTDTTVTIRIGATVAASAHTTVRWYVAEFEGAVSVQRGTANFAAAATQPGGALVTLTTPVDCARSFVLITERTATTVTNNDEQWQVNATLTAAGGSAPRAPCTSGTTSSLELLRGDSGTIVLDVAWQVVQMEGIGVQRGRACIGPSASPCEAVAGGGNQGLEQNETITSINTAKSFVLTTQRAGTAVAGNEGEYRVRADFSSSTNLRFSRGVDTTTANHHVWLTWEVVSLNDLGRVERNAFASPATLDNAVTSTTTAAFTTVYQARALPFVSSSYGTSSATQHASVMLTAALNQTTQTLARSGNANVATIAWQAVEFFGCNTDPTLCHVSVSALSGTTADTASVRISWWPVMYASGNPCFSAGVSPSACNVMVLRATFASGQTPSDISPTLSNGTSYTQGVLLGGGACTPTNGSTTNPCVVHAGTLTASAVATFATDCWVSLAPCGGPNLKNDGTTYVYRVYVRTGPVSGCAVAPCWTSLATSLSQVSVQPKVRSAAGGMQWVYHPSGGASLNSPIADFNNKVYAVNSTGKVFSIDTSTGAELSLPVMTPGPALGYPAWWPAFAGGTQVVIGDQSGYVTSFDGITGKRLWTRRIHTDPEDSTKGNIQAAVVVQDRVFSNQAWKDHYTNTYSYTGDVVFAATRNTTPGAGPTANQNRRNKVYALRASDGSYLWTFDPNNAAGDCNPQYAMDIVVGTPWVDYARNSLYVPSEDGPTAGQHSMWILNTLGPTSGGPASDDCRGSLKQLFGALLDNDFTIWQNYDTNTFYFQTLNGFLRAYDADSQSPRIGQSSVIITLVSGQANFPIKGSIWQDYNKYLEGKNRFYFVLNNGGVWCVDENQFGTDFERCPNAEWPINPIYQHSGGGSAVTTGATPLAAGMLLEPHLWFGGQAGGTGNFGRGTIFQLSTVNGARQTTYVVDSASNLGEISVAESADALFIGSEAGRIYRINLSGFYGGLP